MVNRITFTNEGGEGGMDINGPGEDEMDIDEDLEEQTEGFGNADGEAGNGGSDGEDVGDVQEDQEYQEGRKAKKRNRVEAPGSTIRFARSGR
ncbi:hypothetical protein BGZ79_005761 [Entomortierella chlamydospora]|nr:hypothetical protein BGZ79_005761 [Entomortierella chlamydospora]